MEKIKKIFDTDWIDFICQKYKEIPENDRKIFWILFISVNLMFLFHTINFLCGPFEWWDIKFIKSSNFYEGRFGASILKYLFFQGQILPIINNVFAFLGFVLGTIFLFKYWELDNKVKYFVIAGLILTCSPMIKSRLFQISYIIELVWLIFFIAIGLSFAIKKGRKLYNFISVLSLLLAISIYQPCINTIFVALFGKLFIKAIEGKFKELLFIFKNSFVNICISVSLYFLIYKICVIKNMVDTSFYNQGIINNFSLLIEHFKLTFCSIYSELFNYECILMPKIISKLFFIITVFSVIVWISKILFENKDKKIILKKIIYSTSIFILLLLSTQIAQIIAAIDVFGNPRIVFYGSLFFQVFMLVFILKFANIKIKNITYFICFILFMEYITVNFVWQKALKFATISEFLTIDRIAARIEEHPNFSPDKIYDVFFIGNIKPAMNHYVGHFNKGFFSWEMGSLSVSSPISSSFFFYNNDTIKTNNVSMIYEDYNPIYNIDENILIITQKHINELKPWPCKNSIIIDDNLIIVVLDNNELNTLKSYLNLQISIK